MTSTPKYFKLLAADGTAPKLPFRTGQYTVTRFTAPNAKRPAQIFAVHPHMGTVQIKNGALGLEVVEFER